MGRIITNLIFSDGHVLVPDRYKSIRRAFTTNAYTSRKYEHKTYTYLYLHTHEGDMLIDERTGEPIPFTLASENDEILHTGWELEEISHKVSTNPNGTPMREFEGYVKFRGDEKAYYASKIQVSEDGNSAILRIGSLRLYGV